jgi:hypothetical protein
MTDGNLDNSAVMPDSSTPSTEHSRTDSESIPVPAAPSAELPSPAWGPRDWLLVAVLLVLATATFFDVLIGIHELYMRDLTRYYYPTKQILRDIVAHGEFPYWNRYFSAGQPIAANPEHEVFYPLTWLILLPSYDLGYRLHILIHVYIGLIGMYALLRSMELRRFAALFGAVAWGLGGLYLSYINLLPILFCAAWIPVVCLFVRRFLLHRKLRDFCLAALFLGLEFLVGEPTTVAQTGFILGCYGLYRAWYDGRTLGRFVSRTFLVGLISIGGLLIGAAQILPALEHVHDSARSRPFGFDLVSAWSFHPAKLLELIFPNILGHISIRQVMWYWAGGFYPGMGSPFLFSIYVGILVTALCIGGAFIRPRGGRLVLGLGAVSLLLALGGHTPLLRLLYDWHLATTIRYPEKFALMGIFAMIVFAAKMLDQLLEGDEGLRQSILGFLIATVIAAAVMAVAGFTPTYARLFMKTWGMSNTPNARFMVTLSRNDWIIAAVRGVLAAALIWAARRRRWWYAAALLFVVADLGMVTYELNPRMPRRFFQPPPAAAFVAPHRIEGRLFHEGDWFGNDEIARQYFSTGDAVYWVVRNGLFPMTPAGSGIRTVLERDYDKTALLPTVDFVDSMWDVKRNGKADWAEIFMAMSNVRYRADYRPFASERDRVHGDFKKSQPVHLVDVLHNPRYYFADQIVTIRDRDEFVKRLSTGSYSRRVAFVTEPAFVPAAGRVLHASETANTVTIDVEAEGQAFLVMSVTPHKYWRIFIDGALSPARTVNIGYQGVVVTPGRHRIVMRYWNDLVRVGLAISTLSVLGLLSMMFFHARLEESPLHQVAYEEELHVDGEGVVVPAVPEQEPMPESEPLLPEESAGEPAAVAPAPEVPPDEEPR